MRIKWLVLFSILVLTLGIVAGCGTNNNNHVSEVEPAPAKEIATESTVGEEENNEVADTKAQMIIANYIISEQGVHEMDEQIAQGELDESFLRNVQHAKSIFESITWDSSLDEILATFNQDINDLEKALIANDVEEAKEPAAALHESQHDLDNAVSNLINEFVQLTNSNQAESKSENQNVDIDEVDGTVLTMYDWDFDDITLQKGKNVIILKNEGDMPHGVLIPELGVVSDDVGGGDTLIWEIEVDETGEFTFYCSIPE